MRLYFHTNDPQSVLPDAPPEYDDVELVLTRTSARSRDFDVVIRISIPDNEMDRLTEHGHGKWVATNADLRRAGATIECATSEDQERAIVYALAAERRKKVQTIARVRRYIEEATDRPEASQFAMMLGGHEHDLTDLDNAIIDGVRAHDVRHLDTLHEVAV
jgi:hypothetical protein